jgi:hypothetical protein
VSIYLRSACSQAANAIVANRISFQDLLDTPDRRPYSVLCRLSRLAVDRSGSSCGNAQQSSPVLCACICLNETSAASPAVVWLAVGNAKLPIAAGGVRAATNWQTRQ